MDSKKIPYTDTYKEKCKVAWYSAGRVEPMMLVKKLKADKVEDEYGRIATNQKIGTWMREYSWHLWADDMDAKAMILVEDDLILKKANMLREQAQRGFDLQEMGMASLREDGFDSASAAVHAVIKGAELERTSRGIGEFILKMAKMSNDDLVNEIQKELQKGVAPGQVIEVNMEDVPKEEKENDTESN